MKVLFLHGLGVKPSGIKPSYLRQLGCHVCEPALPHGDFQQAVSLAQRAFDDNRHDVIVGDCRGGSVALALQSGAVPLVLIAPAWKKWGRVNVTKPNTVILHCPDDRVIPFEHSRELLRRSALPDSGLWITGRDHFMDSRAALDLLGRAVQQAAGPALTHTQEATATNAQTPLHRRNPRSSNASPRQPDVHPGAPSHDALPNQRRTATDHPIRTFT